VLPWNHENRRRTFNAAMNARIGQAYKRPQQELVQRIMRAINVPMTKATHGCRATAPGIPAAGSVVAAPTSSAKSPTAASGPGVLFRSTTSPFVAMAIPNPMQRSAARCTMAIAPTGTVGATFSTFRRVPCRVSTMLMTETQRRTAVMNNSPGEGAQSIRFRRDNYPGIAAGDLTPDQRRLVETVMRELLSPYRREDADEVMALIAPQRRTGAPACRLLSRSQCRGGHALELLAYRRPRIRVELSGVASRALLRQHRPGAGLIVANFFKFHALSDIEAEVRRLGLDLRFSSDFAPLFQPVQVAGHSRVGNAFCVQPMEGCDGTLDGHPDELVYRRYQRFGAGGAKLIWGRRRLRPRRGPRPTRASFC